MDLEFFIGLFLLCFSFVLLLDLGLLNWLGWLWYLLPDKSRIFGRESVMSLMTL